MSLAFPSFASFLFGSLSFPFVCSFTSLHATSLLACHSSPLVSATPTTAAAAAAAEKASSAQEARTLEVSRRNEKLSEELALTRRQFKSFLRVVQARLDDDDRPQGLDGVAALAAATAASW
jgi:hypothetical protein